MEYRGLKLDEFQILSIQALQRGDNVLVSAPTGTGKTITLLSLITCGVTSPQQP